MAKKDDGLKVLKAEIVNFKNITQKTVDFAGKSAIVLGANRKGKSSLIQAILSPVNSKAVPLKPIKDGEERASIELQIGGTINGEHRVYNIDMHFTDKHQRGQLVVTDESGGKIPGGKSMIDSIVGNIGFDILEFIDLGLTPDGKVSTPGVQKQIEVLKGFMPEDVRKKIFELDNEKKSVYDERTEINKDIKSNQAKLKDAEMDPAEQEKYAKKIDDSEIKEQMSKIGEDISKYDQVVNGMSTKMAKAEAIEKEIERLEGLIKDLKEEKVGVDSDIDNGKKWLEKKGDRPNMGDLTEKFNAICEHNEKHKMVSELQSFAKNVRDFEVKSEEKTERLKAIDVEKNKMFEENPLPVKGLSFTEDEILYDGLPFNENQHPSSTIIGIGIKIAMEMNPNLRLLVVKDGSLLDKKTLNFILKLVEKNGYQVLIEMVDFSGEKDVTIEFVEGEIK